MREYKFHLTQHNTFATNIYIISRKRRDILNNSTEKGNKTS